MNQVSKNAALWVFLFFALILLYNVVEKPNRGAEEIPYSEFREAIEEGKIREVVIKDNQILGEFLEGFGSGSSKKFVSNPPPNDTDLIADLRKSKIKFSGSPKNEESWYILLLANWFPMILLIGVWIFFMRQIQVGGGKALSFGKSKAKMQEEGPSKITFADVAGIDESKDELQAIVDFLKDPKKFTKLGGRIPRGVLLVGSPGTGKTLLAKAIAGEAGVPFFSISGSDFVEMFVGVGASRVRDLFMKGKKNAPCIIFIDEIDAVGRHRGAGLGGGHDEREQTLNQLLVEMDGFEANEGVILVAATNRPDVLDPALLRPGRFDRTVVVPLPDVRGREGVLKVHIKNVPIAEDVNLHTIARGTPGFTGADLANLVNEAALYAALQGGEKVHMKDFEHAKDKILMGTERKSLVLTEEEKRTTAYHEAGHAILAILLPHADPVHKVTIVPRGVALGLMQQLPTDDKHTYTKDYWEDRICIAFGGRAAEQIIFGNLTTGASSDIAQATNIARKMVCEWGMSEKLGPLAYGKNNQEVFLGKDFGHQKDYSESTADMIDDEVRKIVETNLERAHEVLGKNRDILDALTEALLKEETLDAEQISKIVNRLRPEPSPSSSGNGAEIKAA